VSEQPSYHHSPFPEEEEVESLLPVLCVKGKSFKLKGHRTDSILKIIKE